MPVGESSRTCVEPPRRIRRAPVSGTERSTLDQYGTLIQTDARLDLGTSGGALVNLQGEMIGLTTSLAAMAGYEQPAGFAIPVDDAFRKTVETLEQGRLPAFGFLGVQPDHLPLADRQAGRFGARVLRVVPGTPGEKAGLQTGRRHHPRQPGTSLRQELAVPGTEPVAGRRDGELDVRAARDRCVSNRRLDRHRRSVEEVRRVVTRARLPR